VAGEGLLAGVGVAVTRGEGPEGPLTLLLKEDGARVLDWGSIGFEPPEDPELLNRALERIGEYDWVVFSSPRAVEAVVSRVGAAPEGVKMAVVGPATAVALGAEGWPVDRVPEVGSGQGLVMSFRAAGDAAGARVFFPASAIARDEIPRGLTELGAQVEQVAAYRMVTLPLDREGCRDSLERGEVQVVTFASPSAMEGLREGVGEELFGRLALEVPAAAMGPTTAGALREAGWRRLHLASIPNFSGLVEAVRDASRDRDNSRQAR
jgi:uroporphyrinogen-III synthase